MDRNGSLLAPDPAGSSPMPPLDPSPVDNADSGSG